MFSSFWHLGTSVVISFNFVGNEQLKMDLNLILKSVCLFLGGCIGWVVGEFESTFPLIVVMIAFVLYDAWTAYRLDKRVKLKYPDKTKHHEAKFTSFAFGKVVRRTIPERLVLILLAFAAQRWVFVDLDLQLHYVATGVILFEQIWSALENNSSCRDDTEGRIWKVLQKVMVSKVERHFDVELDELKEKEKEESI